MSDLQVVVLDTGSDTVKAGYCYPDRDPTLVSSSTSSFTTLTTHSLTHTHTAHGVCTHRSHPQLFAVWQREALELTTAVL
jgi:hypothetical protein